ncbi:MAG: hypothetical protein KF787_04315 [Phycisphaeraceae bacterium]|nr:hypothetical protein [Phycisphaerae bacterium]MBX3391851.1 hypothetical protein [Phycisphaeraceae bacterium]
MRTVKCLVTAVIVLLFASSPGCGESSLRPAKPAVMVISDGEGSPLTPYTAAQLRSDLEQYRAAMDRIGDGDAARRQARECRDMMISRIRADIRWNSGEFEEHLRERMAGWETGADLAELSLSLATTVTGGEGSKTVLAAILTAVKGARISVDKNYFREKTSEALIAMLRASRIEKDTLIVRKMTALDAHEYTFEEAWNDLIDLYYAGTLTSALQRLADHAGAKSEEAQAGSKRAEGDRIRRAEYNRTHREKRDRISLWLDADDLADKPEAQRNAARADRVKRAQEWLRVLAAGLPMRARQLEDPNLFVENATLNQLDAFIAAHIEPEEP